MDTPGNPLKSLSQRELLEEIAGNLRYLRRVLSEYEPLFPALKAGHGNGTMNYVQAAGIRRALRKAAKE